MNMRKAAICNKRFLLIVGAMTAFSSIATERSRAQESGAEPLPTTRPAPEAKKLKPKPRPAHAEKPAVQASNGNGLDPKSVGVGKHICVIDRAVVDKQASVNVSSNKRLKDLRDGAQAAVDDSKKKIEAQSQANDVDIRDRPNDLALKQKRQALATQMQGVVVRANLFSREYEVTRQVVTAQLQSATAPIVHAVASAGGCSVVLAKDTIIDQGDSQDLSQLVIEKMNAELQYKPFSMVNLDNK